MGDADAFDVVVIGAGPAGYVCAIRAAQLGKRVAVVDRQWLGGVCLNVGCIPSKALLRNAGIVHLVRHRAAEFGLSFGPLDSADASPRSSVRADYGVAVQRSRDVSGRLVKGIDFLLRKNGVEVIIGDARLGKPGLVTVGERELRAEAVVIATGSSAVVPGPLRVEGADGSRVVQTSWEAIVDLRLPERAVIVGASAIGVEFATIWGAYGTQVTLVEMAPRIVPAEDEDVSKELTRQLKRRGIDIRTGQAVSGVAVSGATATVSIGDDTVEADRVLVAAGIRPNSGGLGLVEAGVAVDARGYVTIDDRMATSVPGVWAIGDVTGKLALAHVGQAQGIICAEAIAGHPTVPLDYEMLPRATYCEPQVASFGLTEVQAKARVGAEHVGVARFDFAANGKALGMGDGAGFVKLVSDIRYGELLGAHLIGPEVTELLPELTLARSAELTVEDIARNVHAHPTLSEALLDAVHGLVGGYIHK